MYQIIGIILVSLVMYKGCPLLSQSFFPGSFGEFIWRQAQGESVNLERRTVDWVDHKIYVNIFRVSFNGLKQSGNGWRFSHLILRLLYFIRNVFLRCLSRQVYLKIWIMFLTLIISFITNDMSGLQIIINTLQSSSKIGHTSTFDFRPPQVFGLTQAQLIRLFLPF